MSSIVDELIISLGLEVNSGAFETVRRMGDGLTQITNTALKMGAGITAAVAGWLYSIDKMDSMGVTIFKLSREFNESTEVIQKWMYIFKQGGYSAEEAAASIKKLDEAFANIHPGQKNIPFFDLFGNMDYEKYIHSNYETRIEGIYAAIRKRSRSKDDELYWANYVGLSDAEIGVMQQGKGAIDAQKKAALSSQQIIPQAVIDQAEKGSVALKNIWGIVQALSAEWASSFTPELERIAEAMRVWVEENKKLIIQDMEAVIKRIGDGFDYLAEQFKKSKPAISEGWENLKSVGKDLGLIWEEVRKTFANLGADLSPDSIIMNNIKMAVSSLVMMVNAMATAADYAQAILADITDRQSPAGAHWDAAAKRSDIRDKKMQESLERIWTGKSISDIPALVEPTTGRQEGAGTYTGRTGKLPQSQGKSGRAHAIMDALMKGGLSREAAAALTGVWQYESAGLHSDMPEKGGGGYGLAQWTGKRRRELEAFANAAGKPVSDLQTQVAFALHEIQSHPEYAKLRGHGSLEEMLRFAVNTYEAPRKDLREKEYQRSLQNAQRIHQGDVNITQHIHGNDAHEIADRSHKKMKPYLQQTYPGSFAPTVA